MFFELMDLTINLTKGKYIVAVSGGVDSMALLDVLSKSTHLKLIVAHFNHGIRKDSDADESLVKKIAEQKGILFVSKKGRLRPDASEKESRKARYLFLNDLSKKFKADAIITAHHQDDLIETSIINILRGTNRRGLTALKSHNNLIRPLLLYPKQELIKYAKQHKLEWHEDSTNKDKKYLRNKIRIDIVPKMSQEQRVHWLKILNSTEIKNQKIDKLLEIILKKGLHKGNPILNRDWFCLQPHSVGKEIIAYIIHKLGVQDIDRRTIERLCVQIKTLPPGKIIQSAGFEVMLTKRSARFILK